MIFSFPKIDKQLLNDKYIISDSKSLFDTIHINNIPQFQFLYFESINTSNQKKSQLSLSYIISLIEHKKLPHCSGYDLLSSNDDLNPYVQLNNILLKHEKQNY